MPEVKQLKSLKEENLAGLALLTIHSLWFAPAMRNQQIRMKLSCRREKG